MSFLMMLSVKSYECKQSPFFISNFIWWMGDPSNMSWLIMSCEQYCSNKYIKWAPSCSTIFDIQRKWGWPKTWKETRAIRADHRHANILLQMRLDIILVHPGIGSIKKTWLAAWPPPSLLAPSMSLFPRSPLRVPRTRAQNRHTVDEKLFMYP